ncbi:MAG: 2-dehydro-3-deoxyphosphogluconate aldolase [Segetibacter sp.]|nr:2-dehydro-3-deoxyphosphogluconate aldolase [Segetibacter sp.]
MNEKKFSWELFSKVPIIGIVRNLSLDEVIQILPLYQEVGLTTIEITMNTPGAEEMIRYSIDHFSTGLNIGAGTVCTKEDLKKAIAAGAQFIVTPIISKKVIRSCVKQEIPIFPGAFSPTEIYKASLLGASMIKVYPAKILGPGYIKDVKAPLNNLKLLPTGGVDLDNLVSFRKAGADGFGIGSQLFNKKLIRDKNWEGLKAHFKQFVELVKTPA